MLKRKKTCPFLWVLIASLHSISMSGMFVIYRYAESWGTHGEFLSDNGDPQWLILKWNNTTPAYSGIVLIFHPEFFHLCCIRNLAKDLPARDILVSFKINIMLTLYNVLYNISLFLHYRWFLYNYTVIWYHFIIRYLDEVFSCSF